MILSESQIEDLHDHRVGEGGVIPEPTLYVAGEGGSRGDLPGIPHVTKSIKPLFWAGEATEWDLPGRGYPYSGCGKYRSSEGCLDLEAHSQMHFDGEDHVGQVYIKRIHQSCYRASCPTCFEDWISREADRAAYRLLAAAKGRGKIIHVTVSVPQSDYLLGITEGKFTELRKKAYRIIKKCGVWGGLLIYHPFRQDDLTLGWYYSPHFHILGYGWIHGVKAEYESSGWIVKNIGVREDPFTVVRYQLSHCGNHPSYHSVTWFGGLAYNKLRIPPMPEVKHVCPLCGAELRPVVFVGGPDPLMDLPKNGYWVGPDGWEYHV